MTKITNNSLDGYEHISGLPVTGNRAEKLARTIAKNIDSHVTAHSDAKVVNALVALLLGIAPDMRIYGQLNEIDKERLRAHNRREPLPEYPVELIEELLLDLWTRRQSFLRAVAVLYTFTDEFAAAFDSYMEEIGQHAVTVKSKGNSHD